MRLFLKPMETSIKKLILVSACALALAVGGAMAKTQPAAGASPGVSKHTTHMKHAKHMKKGTTGQTTGMARSKETTGQTTGKAPSKGTSATPSGGAKQPSGRY